MFKATFFCSFFSLSQIKKQNKQKEKRAFYFKFIKSKNPKKKTYYNQFALFFIAYLSYST